MSARRDTSGDVLCWCTHVETSQVGRASMTGSRDDGLKPAGEDKWNLSVTLHDSKLVQSDGYKKLTKGWRVWHSCWRSSQWGMSRTTYRPERSSLHCYQRKNHQFNVLFPRVLLVSEHNIFGIWPSGSCSCNKVGTGVFHKVVFEGVSPEADWER